MSADEVGECVARVFLRADHAPLKGEDLWKELVGAGLSYREAKAVPGRIQRGELPDYGFAKKGKQRTAYYEKKHADRLERGYLPQPFLGADLAKGRWVPVAAIYHTPGGPDAFQLKRLVDEARRMVLSRQPRRFLGLLRPMLDVAEFDRVFRERNPQVYQMLRESCKAYDSNAWSIVELDGGAYLIPMTLTPVEGAPPVPGGFVLLSS
jgi:hypothetical protein